ncbi:hypothetical protein D3C71_1491420 [compost metagenome]
MTVKTPKRLNRLTLTISDELKAALADLNDATGVAAASFVGEIIEGNIAMIRGIAEAARKAKTEPSRALEIMQRSMLEAIHGVSSVQLELMNEQTKLRTFQRKDACTCTITEHERQENPACPVHFPGRGQQ